MKISFLAFGEPFPNRHASFTHISEKMKAVASMGNEVKIFAKAPDNERKEIGSYLENRRSYKVMYVSFPKYKNLQNPLNFLKSKDFVVKESRDCDVIHERFYPETFSTSIARELKKPYIVEMNNPVAEEINNPALKKIASKIREEKLKSCNAIITQTKTLRNIISSFTDKPVYVVPNGVNNSYFVGKGDWLRKDFSIGKDEVIVTFVGAFRPWHGMNQIPAIMAAVQKENKNVRFVFIGGAGRDIDKMLKLPHGSKALVLGEIEYDKVVRYLLSSDVLIAPFDTSRYKYLEDLGFWWCPVKLFEYLAAGKPVVSYGYDEVRNIVKDAGLLAEPGDVSAFCKNLLKLVENAQLRKKLGNNAKKLARNYDWKIRARETVKVYNNFI